MSKSDNVKNWRKRTKLRMVESFGGCCGICGYNTTENALEFHHLDPTEKEFSFGGARANIISWKRMIVELRKCIMVCSNCHREIHAGILDVPGDVMRFDEKYTDYRKTDDSVFVKKLIKRKLLSYDNCPMCGVKKKENLKYCSSECASKSQRKVDRPSKDELYILIQENSWLALGRMFGVSDNSVRKWARNYDLI